MAHELIARAVTRWGASNLVEVQAVYGGHAQCYTPPDPFGWVELWISVEAARWLRRVDWIKPAPERWCTLDLGQERTEKLCARMRRRNVSCWAPITEEDLGRVLPATERREWALETARAQAACLEPADCLG